MRVRVQVRLHELKSQLTNTRQTTSLDHLEKTGRCPQPCNNGKLTSGSSSRRMGRTRRRTDRTRQVGRNCRLGMNLKMNKSDKLTLDRRLRDYSILLGRLAQTWTSSLPNKGLNRRSCLERCQKKVFGYLTLGSELCLGRREIDLAPDLRTTLSNHFDSWRTRDRA